jgi:hypothetical protein
MRVGAIALFSNPRLIRASIDDDIYDISWMDREKRKDKDDSSDDDDDDDNDRGHDGDDNNYIMTMTTIMSLREFCEYKQL